MVQCGNKCLAFKKTKFCEINEEQNILIGIWLWMWKNAYTLLHITIMHEFNVKEYAKNKSN